MEYYINNGTFYAVPTKSDELMHYGIPGMKWGVRRSRSVNSVRQRKIGPQFFAKKASSRKTPRLSKRESAHVLSELATHITKEQKTYPTVIKNIGNYTYVFENNFDGTYRVIGRKKNPGVTSTLSKGRKQS